MEANAELWFDLLRDKKSMGENGRRCLEFTVIPSLETVLHSYFIFLLLFQNSNITEDKTGPSFCEISR